MGDKALSWASLGMTCLGIVISILAVLLPEQRALLIFLAAAFFVGGIAAFREAFRARKRSRTRPTTLCSRGIEVVDQQLRKASATLYVLTLILRTSVEMDRLQLWTSEPLIHQKFKFGETGKSANNSMTVLRNPEPSVLEVGFADRMATKGAILVLEVGAAVPLEIPRIESH